MNGNYLLPDEVYAALIDGPNADERFHDEWKRRELFAARIARIAFLAGSKPAPEGGAWVKAEDRIPPLQELVLALTVDGDYVLTYRTCGPNDTHSHWFAQRSDEVTYWHRLPDAPLHLPRSTKSSSRPQRDESWSTSYNLVCFTCKAEGPSFASGSIAYGFKIWNTDEWFKWLGHGKDNGHHEGHDLRIVSEHVDLPWDDSPNAALDEGEKK